MFKRKEMIKEKNKENKKNLANDKKKRGITLVGLVITVAIMIIIAGVVINLVFEENGIISKTKLAKKVFLGEEARQVVEDRVNTFIEQYGIERELDFCDFWFMYNGDPNLDTYDPEFIVYLFCEEGAISFTPSKKVYSRGVKYTSAVVLYKGFQVTVDENLKVGQAKELDNLTIEEVSKIENESIYTLNPCGWTNGDVTVTFKDKARTTVHYGMDKDNMTDTGNTFTCSSNAKYYYRYIKDDVVECDGEINVGNIDKVKPMVSTELTGVIVGPNNNDISLTIGVIDTLSGYSKVEFKHKFSSTRDYTNVTPVGEIAMNGTQKGLTTATTITGKIERLSVGTYDICADVYDVAGNCVSSNTITIDVAPAANAPEITQGMVPVKWDDGKWVICSSENNNKEWFEYIGSTNEPGIDYSSSRWANVMLMDGLTVYNNGISGTTTEVTNSNLSSMIGKTVSNVGSMFVWIPRYEYKINTENIGSINKGVDVTTLEAGNNVRGTVEVNFIPVEKASNSNGFTIHPAFTSNVDNGGWSRELSGIWVAKFEATASSISETDEGTFGSGHAKVMPNAISWRNLQIRDMFTACRNITGTYATTYGFTVDTDQGGTGKNYAHLMKNSEWGAVAYLAHSKYGRNGFEISNNDDESYITGAGYYNANVAQTTTGNIYGIYDMSGGAYEMVSAYNCYTDYPESIDDIKIMAGITDYNITEEEGFLYANGSSTKYVTKYENETGSNFPSQEKSKIGDATYEVRTNGRDDYAHAWFLDISENVYSGGPFFARGGIAGEGEDAGIFQTFAECYSNDESESFRPVIVVEPN